MHIFNIIIALSLSWLVRSSAPPYDGFDIIWEDSFEGSAGSLPDSSKWIMQDWYQDLNGDWQTYTTKPENQQLTGHGSLLIIPLKDSSAVKGWTSGRLESAYTFTPAPGARTIAEASLRLGSAPASGKKGIWPAFWLLGDSHRKGTLIWPTCGEIDIMENVNGEPKTQGVIHCDKNPGGICNEKSGIAGATNLPDAGAGFHTYTAIIDRTPSNWKEESVTFYLDGVKYHEVSGAKINNEEVWGKIAHNLIHFILNVAVGGEWPGPPNESTVSGLENAMEVEYVAHYQSSGSGGTPVQHDSGSGQQNGVYGGVNEPKPAPQYSQSPPPPASPWYPQSSHPPAFPKYPQSPSPSPPPPASPWYPQSSHPPVFPKYPQSPSPSPSPSQAFPGYPKPSPGPSYDAYISSSGDSPSPSEEQMFNIIMSMIQNAQATEAPAVHGRPSLGSSYDAPAASSGYSQSPSDEPELRIIQSLMQKAQGKAQGSGDPVSPKQSYPRPSYDTSPASLPSSPQMPYDVAKRPRPGEGSMPASSHGSGMDFSEDMVPQGYMVEAVDGSVVHEGYVGRRSIIDKIPVPMNHFRPDVLVLEPAEDSGSRPAPGSSVSAASAHPQYGQQEQHKPIPASQSSEKNRPGPEIQPLTPGGGSQQQHGPRPAPGSSPQNSESQYQYSPASPASNGQQESYNAPRPLPPLPNTQENAEEDDEPCPLDPIIASILNKQQQSEPTPVPFSMPDSQNDKRPSPFLPTHFETGSSQSLTPQQPQGVSQQAQGHASQNPAGVPQQDQGFPSRFSQSSPQESQGGLSKVCPAPTAGAPGFNTYGFLWGPGTGKGCPDSYTSRLKDREVTPYGNLVILSNPANIGTPNAVTGISTPGYTVPSKASMGALITAVVAVFAPA